MFRRSACFLEPKAITALRYVASDMDGTLLSPKHQLTPYAKDTLRLLTQKRGIPFIFATGRMNADVHIVNENLQAYFKNHNEAAKKAAQAPMYMVTSNGAVGRDALTNELVYQRTIDPAIAYELYHHVIPKNETRVNCNLNQNDVWFCRYNWEEVLAFHQESGLTFQVVPDTPELLRAPNAEHSSASASSTTIRDGDFTGVVKFFYTCWDRPLLERLEAYLQERYKDVLTINISASYCIDIQAKGVDKAHGLRSIFAHMAEKELGAAAKGDSSEAMMQQQVEMCMKQAIAFGDDLNDKGMLVNVGRGFVMENANPKLKDEAAEGPYKDQLEIIGNNANDSVSRKIRELFDLQE